MSAPLFQLSQMFVTRLQVPGEGSWVIGYSSGQFGNHTEGHYDIMRYDGGWWNDCGTEVADDAPEMWGYLP